jgi:PRC-barrel domain
MTTAEQLEQWQGRHVVDADGAEIGKLEDVYYAADGEPVLARVGSGIIGRHHRLVPLANSSVGRDYLRVAYRKDEIEHANAEAADGATIDAEAASAIGTRYGVILTSAVGGLESSAQLEERRAQAAAAQERAAALEARAVEATHQAETTRAHAELAVDTATQAERDATAARNAAVDARTRAEAASTSTAPAAEQP